jgi:hypothetical protein
VVGAVEPSRNAPSSDAGPGTASWAFDMLEPLNGAGLGGVRSQGWVANSVGYAERTSGLYMTKFNNNLNLIPGEQAV